MVDPGMGWLRLSHGRVKAAMFNDGWMDGMDGCGRPYLGRAHALCILLGSSQKLY